MSRDWNRERIINDLVREREHQEMGKHMESIKLQNKLGYITDSDYKKFMLGEKDWGVVVHDPTKDFWFNIQN